MSLHCLCSAVHRLVPVCVGFLEISPCSVVHSLVSFCVGSLPWKGYHTLPVETVSETIPVTPVTVRNLHGNCISAHIGTFEQTSEWKDSLNQLELASIQLDYATYASLLRLCCRAKALLVGKRVHCHITESGLEQNIILSNHLLRLYGQCGALEDARALFSRTYHRNAISWNFMLVACIQNKQGTDTFRLFEDMLLEGVVPDKFILASILAACAIEIACNVGKQIHARVVGSRSKLDLVVENALLYMYSKCGTLEDAETMFGKMFDLDVVSWTTMIAACAHHSQGEQAFRLFEQMQGQGVLPNKITFIGMLDACASPTVLTTGKGTHARVVGSTMASDSFVATAAVNMYVKCGRLNEGRKLFDLMPQRDVVLYNAMIAAYMHYGQTKDALDVLKLMHWEGIMTDQATFLSILEAFTSPLALAEGKRMHVQILGCKYSSEVTVGTALINMYSKCGSLEDARRTFDKMPVQNTVTFLSFFCACANHAALLEGKQMHVTATIRGFELNIILGNALINMYSKCGSLEDAHSIFDQMPERDCLSWTTIIAAYAQYGHGNIALQLFDQMQRVEVLPDDVTFVSILSACSHNGLVNEGCHFFLSMQRDFGITQGVDHYDCMIDLLGRAGQLDEAENLIKNMPSVPGIVTWTTYLGACRNLADVGRGEHAAHYLFALDPGDPASYVTLSNIYAAAGRVDDAAKVMDWMRGRALRSRGRLAHMKSKGRVHEFLVINHFPSLQERDLCSAACVKYAGGKTTMLVPVKEPQAQCP